jgi:DnaJ homolog subfamily C member 3
MLIIFQHLRFSRLIHLSCPSTHSLMRVFRLSYFFLPAASSPSSQPSALSILKQCLHFDPYFKHCLPAHRLVKNMDKSFAHLENLVSKEDWRTVVNLVGVKKEDKGKAFAHQFDEAMDSNISREQLLSADSRSQISLPNPHKSSPRRQDIFRAVCRAYVQL